MNRALVRARLLQRDAVRRSRRGVSVVEVIIAIVVLSIGMVGIAGTLVQAGRRAIQLSTQSGRATTQLQQLSRASALPYDSLPNTAGCVTISAQPFPHTRCTTVTDSTGGVGYRKIRIIITPTNGRLRADTMTLVRTKGVATNPLGT